MDKKPKAPKIPKTDPKTKGWPSGQEIDRRGFDPDKPIVNSPWPQPQPEYIPPWPK